MARSKAKIGHNLNAFLDGLAWAEGTSTSPITLDDGYDIIVTGIDGPERFIDYSTHPFSNGRPSKRINARGLTSNAAGRYQFMLKDYLHYKKQLGLIDFGAISQDVWAIQLIRERRALPLIEMGQIAAAVDLCRNLWASLPGAGYGQQERKMEDFLKVYERQGGVLWDSKQSSAVSLPQSSQLLPPLQQAITEEKQKQPLTQPSDSTNSKPSGLLNLITKLWKR